MLRLSTRDVEGKITAKDVLLAKKIEHINWA